MMMSSRVYAYKEETLHDPYIDGLKRHKRELRGEGEINVARVSTCRGPILRMKFLTLAP
jgi:hypothetical protein